mgnify:FL=1
MDLVKHTIIVTGVKLSILIFYKIISWDSQDYFNK